jgi:hypothetical protein
MEWDRHCRLPVVFPPRIKLCVVKFSQQTDRLEPDPITHATHNTDIQRNSRLFS